MRVPAGERSFYQQVQEAAVPAREALLESLHVHAPQGGSEAGPSSPREHTSYPRLWNNSAAGNVCWIGDEDECCTAGTLSLQQQWKAEAAARRAEEAAGSAVLQLRKCCDHPQLTAFWQRHRTELQLQSGMLSIAEQNSRLADFLQGKLQACVPVPTRSTQSQHAQTP